jgi:two-component system, OmpR family, copper resistance phosphate regulon response regulator CusR
MKLLIIEDDPIIAKSLSDFLKSNNYVVDLACDGEDGLSLANTGDYDLVISDYLLPKINGQEIIEQLRRNGNNTPVLAISVCEKTENKVNLLNHGADDYLVKPFFFTELQARIRTLLRRRKPKNKKIIIYADLELNLLSHEAKRNGVTIYLTTKEFMLLKLLMEHPKTIFTRQAINERAWDEARHHFSNVTEAYILKLRHKIDFKKPFLIKTVSGRGYKLDSSD